MFSEKEKKESLEKALEVCKNDKERRIATRVCMMSMDTWLWWQDLEKQIPFLLFVFIGSTIIRNHWVIKIMIIGYLIYGFKVKYDRWYYFEYIYPRLGQDFRKQKGIE
jgi:hypothetical protein